MLHPLRESRKDLPEPGRAASASDQGHASPTPGGSFRNERAAVAIHGDHDDHEVAAVHDGLEILRVSAADAAMMKLGDVASIRGLLRETSHMPIKAPNHRDSHGRLMRDAVRGTAT